MWHGPFRILLLLEAFVLRRILSLVVPFACALVPVWAAAQQPTLEISGATFRPYPIAIASPLASGDEAAPAEEIYEALTFDLEVSGLFEVVPRKAFLADPREPATPDQIKWDRWSDVGADGLVKVLVSRGEKGLTATFRLFDVSTRRLDLEQTYSGSRADARRLAHRFADDLVRHFTKQPGAFATRIAFVKRHGEAREIWVSDWDGRNASPVTQRGGFALLPHWAPNGNELTYTWYRRTGDYPNGHPEIWKANLATGQKTSLVARGNLNTDGVWSPDGTKIALTLSENGNPDIYIANADGSGLKRLTNQPGIDTAPTWSPDGKKIAFVSDRHGNPQIFVMDADGNNVQRLTYQGNYNQTPVWSPRGDEIAFTARDERLAFDIFTINVETREVRRITQGQGNNEGPTWAPNGRMLMFWSTRDGKRALYASSYDGNVQRRIGLDPAAEYTMVSWGPFSSAK